MQTLSEDRKNPHILLKVAPLLAIAEGRLRRQKSYARLLSKGGAGAAAVETLLHKAGSCISELAKPCGVSVPVTAEATQEGIRLAGQVTLVGKDLSDSVVKGASVAIYLQNLGYDQAHAFDWLAGDYAANHVLSDLGNEVLFALSRKIFREQKTALEPGTRVKRVSIQTEAVCGQRRIWNAAKVQELLMLLGAQNLGVHVTDSGCFQPLQSLLGLTIATAPQTGIAPSQR